jgi:UDP-N-acetylglucosamine 2-epimerase (non-hydrolysing)
VTLRDNTERPESLEVGANRLAGADAQRIERAAVEMFDAERNWVQPFGDGHAAERILTVLMNGPSRAG